MQAVEMAKWNVNDVSEARLVDTDANSITCLLGLESEKNFWQA